MRDEDEENAPVLVRDLRLVLPDVPQWQTAECEVQPQKKQAEYFHLYKHEVVLLPVVLELIIFQIMYTVERIGVMQLLGTDIDAKVRRDESALRRVCEEEEALPLEVLVLHYGCCIVLVVEVDDPSLNILIVLI